jgi:protein-S-isoprenylcysteine O-methyltransferase Ste14
MSLWRHIAAVVLLPGVVAVAVPGLLLWRDGLELSRLAVIGMPLITVGLVLIAGTIRLFASVGRGTLAPWDATSRLVVSGPYRYVRNPMITGVLLVLLGDAATFRSLPVLLWFGVVFAVNAVYMPLVEEPGLERRFGDEYRTYKAHVPRWLPQARPWGPEETAR